MIVVFAFIILVAERGNLFRRSVVVMGRSDRRFPMT